MENVRHTCAKTGLQADIKKRDSNLSLSLIVHPWGVEPQSMEPESIILSIELWVHPFFLGTKIQFISIPS